MYKILEFIMGSSDTVQMAVVGILTVLVIISIAGRLAKTAISLVIVTILCVTLYLGVGEFQKQYEFNMDGSIVSFKVSDTKYDIDLNKLESIEIKDLGDKSNNMVVTMKDGSNFSATIDDRVESLIKVIGKHANIEVAEE